MYYDFAPMEGLTTSIFRSIHARFFPGADRYYAPFLAPDGRGKVKASALRELDPEQNRDLRLIPQILCNSAQAFLGLSRELAAMGYGEVDINVGCPSGTVVPKHKGAGMLLDLRSLDRFLAEIFANTELRISVKTRLGLQGTAEFPAILEIYNRYPLSELIIHARDQKGLYQSTPDLGVFRAAFEQSLAPVCYNGNILSLAHRDCVLACVPGLERMMLGRGAAANPALIRQLRGGGKLDAAELSAFLEELFAACLASGLGEYHSLGRMKELWFYMGHMFPGAERERKWILKARTREDYRSAVAALFASGRFDPEASFPGALPS